jgi:hypothetical protein
VSLILHEVCVDVLRATANWSFHSSCIYACTAGRGVCMYVHTLKYTLYNFMAVKLHYLCMREHPWSMLTFYDVQLNAVYILCGDNMISDLHFNAPCPPLGSYCPCPPLEGVRELLRLSSP